MRIKVNASCNVCTGEHSQSYRPQGQPPKPQVTVPSLRLRLSVEEAERLGQHLLQAVERARNTIAYCYEEA
jgi:hypothetical protein